MAARLTFMSAFTMLPDNYLVMCHLFHKTIIHLDQLAQVTSEVGRVRLTLEWISKNGIGRKKRVESVLSHDISRRCQILRYNQSLRPGPRESKIAGLAL